VIDIYAVKKVSKHTGLFSFFLMETIRLSTSTSLVAVTTKRNKSRCFYH